ncbi:helix-turn-helix transcriptional regulator [Sphingomonas sp. CL5.1]|nr:helix-turn-helix transcriptional regulator [Sphingomonas sp. CL5.1]
MPLAPGAGGVGRLAECQTGHSPPGPSYDPRRGLNGRQDGTKHLVPPDRIPEWIPGVQTLDSSYQDWSGITLKGYDYDRQSAAIPPMRDYMIVGYGGSPTSMHRTAGRAREEGEVGPGRVSLLTRAEQSTWAWRDPIQVRHIYLGHEEIETAAQGVFDRDPLSIEISDCVSTEDPLIVNCFDILGAELKCGEFGQRLMVDAVRSLLAVHLLRHYARIQLPDEQNAGLTAVQRNRIVDLINSRLDENISLDELARIAGTSPFQFSRRFKVDFGIAPYRYVIRARVAKAQEMLRRRKVPHKVIAFECGFSDQSHFCRTFRRITGVSPSEYQSKA